METPFYFGSPDRPLFGWWHPGDRGSFRGVTVVVCPPIGFDYVGTYRTFRNLAIRLARLGFDVMRFDYPATGDSAGMPTDPGLGAEWLATVATAVDTARRRSGSHPIALVGARLGATMAALAAPDLDVASLVLWSPYRTGKQYLREVKALDALSGANDEVSGVDLSAAGFTITAATAAEIAGFDLGAIEGEVAERLLIVERDDLDSDRRTIEAASRWGGLVTVDRTPGTGAAFTGPIASTPPVEIMTRIGDWLVAAHPVRAGAPALSEAGPAVAVVSPGCRERVFAVGQEKPLFGILSEPVEGPRPEEAIVFLNSGADYHIGPHRIFVPVARECAAAGLLAFRFDLQGLGDSAVPDSGGENVSYPDHAVADVRRAVAALRLHHGIRRVLLVGLCSGGWHSVRAARAGLEVEGILAINPPLYYGRDEGKEEVLGHHEVKRYRQALGSRGKLLRLLQGKVNLFRVARVIGAEVGRRIGGRLRSWLAPAAPDQTAEDIRWLSAAPFPTLVVFSKADLGWFHFDLHLPLAVRRNRRAIDWEVIDHADHTFRPPVAKARLLELARDFIGEWRRATPAAPRTALPATRARRRNRSAA